MLVIGTQIFGTLPGKKYMKMVKATLRQKILLIILRIKLKFYSRNSRKKVEILFFKNVELTVVSRKTAAIPCTKCLV